MQFKMEHFYTFCWVVGSYNRVFFDLLLHALFLKWKYKPCSAFKASPKLKKEDKKKKKSQKYRGFLASFVKVMYTRFSKLHGNKFQFSNQQATKWYDCGLRLNQLQVIILRQCICFSAASSCCSLWAHKRVLNIFLFRSSAFPTSLPKYNFQSSSDVSVTDWINDWI